MRKFPGLVALILSLGLAGSATASIVHDEAVDGDISNDRFNPDTYVLQSGVNSLLAETMGEDLEYIRLDVPAGFQLNSLIVADWTGDNSVAFIGVQAGTTFTEDPNTVDPGNLLGWSHFGPGVGNLGEDILDDMGASFAIGFTPPLPAASYTYWIQQFDFESVHYQLDFVVGAVPEPASIGLLILGASLMASRRLRRHR